MGEWRCCLRYVNRQASRFKLIAELCGPILAPRAAVSLPVLFLLFSPVFRCGTCACHDHALNQGYIAARLREKGLGHLVTLLVSLPGR